MRPDARPDHPWPPEVAPAQPVRLDPESVEAIAQRVAELLRRERSGGLVDAGELARRLGTSVDYVYRHANELGAQPLGSGAKPRLRFDPETALAAFTRRSGRESQHAETPAKRPRRARRKPPRSGTSGVLVPLPDRPGRRAA